MHQDLVRWVRHVGRHIGQTIVVGIVTRCEIDLVKRHRRVRRTSAHELDRQPARLSGEWRERHFRRIRRRAREREIGPYVKRRIVCEINCQIIPIARRRKLELFGAV